MRSADADFLALQTTPHGGSLKDFTISKVQGPSPHHHHQRAIEAESGSRRVADALRRHAAGKIEERSPFSPHTPATAMMMSGREPRADNPAGSSSPSLPSPPLRHVETVGSGSGGGGSASSNGTACASSTTAPGVSPPSAAGGPPLQQIIETMRNERHQLGDVFLERIRMLETDLVASQQEGETQRLKVQELQETAHRLRKENTVLCAQLAELRGQLEAVGDLCLRRGKALEEAGLKATTTTTEAAHTPERATPSELFRGGRFAAGTPAGIPSSFSIRSAVMAAGSPSHCTPSQALLSAGLAANHAARDDALNRSAKSDGPSFDYNDLIPITKDELDPELLAALHQPEAATVSQVVALSEEVQMLRQQIDAQRSAYEKERGRRLLEERHQQRQFAEEREIFAATLKRTEELSECCLQDLVASRQSYEQKLQAAGSEIVALKKQLIEALDFAETVQRANQQTVAHAEGAAEKKFKQRIADMKNGIALRTQRWEEERRQLVELVEEKQTRVTSLTSQLSAARDKLRREEQRFALEKQGAESELQLMRQSLRQLEKKLYFAKTREESAAGSVEGELPLSKFYLA